MSFALLSAAMLSAAHEVHGLAWLGWFALIPLFLAALRLRGWRAVGAGAVWAAVVGALTGLPAAETALLALAGSGYFWLAATLTRRIGFSPFVLAVGWMLLELALAALGFREGVAASTGMTAVAQFLGTVLVAFLVAYVNALLLELVREVERRWRAAAPNVLAGEPHIEGLPALPLLAASCVARADRPRGPPFVLSR